MQVWEDETQTQRMQKEWEESIKRRSHTTRHKMGQFCSWGSAASGGSRGGGRGTGTGRWDRLRLAADRDGNAAANQAWHSCQPAGRGQGRGGRDGGLARERGREKSLTHRGRNMWQTFDPAPKPPRNQNRQADGRLPGNRRDTQGEAQGGWDWWEGGKRPWKPETWAWVSRSVDPELGIGRHGAFIPQRLHRFPSAQRS